MSDPENDARSDSALARRKLAAILHADVAGYSRLMGQDEEGTHARLMAYRALIEGQLARTGGRVAGTAGDAVLAVFDSVVAALQAAIGIQEVLARENVTVPVEQQLQFRIGLNLGDVIADGDDVFGNGVNVAARIEALAKPGGIAVSSAVREQVEGKLDVLFTDLGPHTVKNIVEPVRVFAVGANGPAPKKQRRGRLWLALAAVAGVAVAAGLLAPRLMAPPAPVIETAEAVVPATTVRPKIAILPFEDRSSDAVASYFGDGVTEDVIAALGRFSGLLVLSWSAVAPLKDNPASPEELRQTLGADFVVSGSVQKAGARVRVGVQMSDAASGSLIWSDRYDVEFSDIFELQDRITRQVVAALAVQVTQLEEARVAAAAPDNMSAYDLVLRGRDLLRKIDRSDNFEARGLFEQAMALDPKYADALVGLGQTHLNDLKFGWTQWPARAAEAAKDRAEAAIAADPQNAAAHALLADTLKFLGDFAAAERAITRSLELNPNNAEHLAAQASIAGFSGHPEEAITAMELALQINPYPRSDALNSLAYGYFLVRRFEDVIALYDRYGAQAGEDPGRFAFEAASHAMLDQMPEAAASADALRRVAPFATAAGFATVFAAPEHRALIFEALEKAGL